MSNERFIIVTGFGPFAGHELINASWEAVKILPDNLISTNKNQYRIEKKLIAVTYDDVDKNVKEIWEKNPYLVVHCGVNGSAKTVFVEKSACNNKFDRDDYTCKKLSDPSLCLVNNGKNCEKLETKLDLKEITENINKTMCVSKINENQLMVSNDAGNYLCGYIYLKSLDVNCEKSLFIHVPPINKPFSSEETSQIILEIIQECIRQIE